MPTRPKVIITDHDFADIELEREILEKAGAQVIALQAKSEQDLLEHAADCAAMINQYAYIGASTIAAMQRCQVIARYGVGTDIVDVAAATARGIQVTNVRNYCTEEVADHAISLWLALARGLFAYDRATHRGEWRWQSAAPLHRLRGQTVGIVSFGAIGQAIAQRAKAFGAQVIIHDPYVDSATIAAHQVAAVGKGALLAESDVVMMQVPMTTETRHFLSEEEFRSMKPNALVVCTGRGPTIDNRALYKALSEGWIAGAGLDDPEEEPAKRKHWSPNDNPLFSLPNVIVTPHAAYYSEESLRAARTIAAKEVARVLAGQSPHNPVNTPSH
ncbi:C-terminal binding protein [Cobetia sp. D5]|uniref:C-terminal binding protein n=1 Tax=unclassified Cobetia TaxID=2609414 RepID=UPI00178CF3E0|nr:MULTISPECIES: C-terminal binding protein [unclassified Cobetia]MBE2167542.1 C-terminal binding protein [Cobetia sp. 2AS1]MDH2447012.1 C-terminal binding protein [Cobetia sp. 2AS]